MPSGLYVHSDGSLCALGNSCTRETFTSNEFNLLMKEKNDSWRSEHNNNIDQKVDKQELIIEDEDIAFMVAECTAVPSPKEPSIFMNKLQHIAEQNGYKINSAVWSWQSMASRMGNILEKVIKITASKTYENTNILYIRGDDLRHEIENIRSNGMDNGIVYRS